MPMFVTKEKSPRGFDYVRMHSTGEVTALDAEELTHKLQPGNGFSNHAILATVEVGTRYSPEARQAFTRAGSHEGGEAKPVAVVVTNAPLRVMLTFIIRMSGAAAHTRFFSSEPAAMAFVEERLSAPALAKAS